MSLQRQVATWLVEICLENGFFGRSFERLDIDEIGDLDLCEGAWFDSMSLVFLQVEIESEWGVHIPYTKFATWLRTLKQIAGYIAEQQPAPGGSASQGMAEARSLS